MALSTAIPEGDPASGAGRAVSGVPKGRVWWRGPAGWLTGAAGIGAVCGTAVDVSAFGAVAAAGVALASGVAWPRAAVAGLRAELRWDRTRCREGDRVHGVLTLRNRWPVSVSGVDVLGLPGAELTGLKVAGRATTEVAVELVAGRRGKLLRGPVRVVSGQPLGVAEAWREVEVGTEVLVWPARVGVSLDEVSGSEGAVSERESRRARRAGNTGETVGVRGYRRGDAVRDVHWRQTARAGELMVRERQFAAVPRARVVLDTDRASYPDDATFEHAVRLAGSVAAVLIERGGRVELEVPDPAPEPTGDISRDRPVGAEVARGGRGSNYTALASILDRLALVEPGGTGIAGTPGSARGVAGDRVIVTTRAGRTRLLGSVRSGCVWVCADAEGGGR